MALFGLIYSPNYQEVRHCLTDWKSRYEVRNDIADQLNISRSRVPLWLVDRQLHLLVYDGFVDSRQSPKTHIYGLLTNGGGVINEYKSNAPLPGNSRN